MEAFRGRARGDFFASHDLEDLTFIVDGRPQITSEVRAEPLLLREFLRREVGELLATRTFMDALPGYLLPDAASQARLSGLVGRLKDLAQV